MGFQVARCRFVVTTYSFSGAHFRKLCVRFFFLFRLMNFSNLLWVIVKFIIDEKCSNLFIANTESCMWWRSTFSWQIMTSILDSIECAIVIWFPLSREKPLIIWYSSNLKFIDGYHFLVNSRWNFKLIDFRSASFSLHSIRYGDFVR